MSRRVRDFSDEPKSRSQLKRESSALQALGEELAALDPASFAQIPLAGPAEGDLRQAVADLRAMTSHEARRRQLQLLGRLMRDIDAAPVQEALARLRETGRVAGASHRQVEEWRDRLADGDESALGEVLAACPGADRQQLRALARAAAQERAAERPPHASRRLFRLLRDLLEAETPSEEAPPDA